MKAGFAFLGAGAGLMYLLDPTRGARRRAIARDKLASAFHTSADAIATTTHDVSNRTSGLVAETWNRPDRGPVPDAKLVARVRSQLGRLVSHPHAITVNAQDGRVTLSGPVLEREADRLCRGVARVRDVGDLVDELTRYKTAEGIPSLQGGPPRRARRGFVYDEQWSPTTRLLVGSMGGVLATYGLSKRTPAGVALAVAGGTLLARATSNLETRRLVGVGAKRRAVEVRKTLTIVAPVAAVYDFWERYDEFPEVMRYVRDVRSTAPGGRSHWTIQLPTGIPIEFDAEITRRVPNELLAWRSVPGSAVQHAGRIRFEPTGDGSTRVDLRFSYNPPAGAIGHALAALIGADAKSLMDEDLVRMKTAIETGRPPHDAAKPSQEEPASSR